MSTDPQGAPRPLPDRPNLRHLKDQAKDLLKAGSAESLTDAQLKIARLYGFASWPKLTCGLMTAGRLRLRRFSSVSVRRAACTPRFLIWDVF